MLQVGRRRSFSPIRGYDVSSNDGPSFNDHDRGSTDEHQLHRDTHALQTRIRTLVQAEANHTHRGNDLDQAEHSQVLSGMRTKLDMSSSHDHEQRVGTGLGLGASGESGSPSIASRTRRCAQTTSVSTLARLQTPSRRSRSNSLLETAPDPDRNQRSDSNLDLQVQTPLFESKATATSALKFEGTIISSEPYAFNFISSMRASCAGNVPQNCKPPRRSVRLIRRTRGKRLHLQGSELPEKVRMRQLQLHGKALATGTLDSAYSTHAQRQAEHKPRPAPRDSMEAAAGSRLPFAPQRELTRKLINLSMKSTSPHAAPQPDEHGPSSGTDPPAAGHDHMHEVDMFDTELARNTQHLIHTHDLHPEEYTPAHARAGHGNRPGGSAARNSRSRLQAPEHAQFESASMPASSTASQVPDSSPIASKLHDSANTTSPSNLPAAALTNERYTSKSFGSNHEFKDHDGTDVDGDLEFGTLLQRMPTSNVYLISSAVLARNMPVWYLQRPVDSERVHEIVQTLERRSEAPWLPGVISCFQLTSTGDSGTGGAARRRMSVGTIQTHGVIDGQHRLIACNTWHLKGGKPVPLLVQVYRLQHADEIKQLFLELNKAESIQEVDLPDSLAPPVRLIIQKAVQALQEQYPAMFKPSARCRAPHVNAAVLRDQIFQSRARQLGKISSASSLLSLIQAANSRLAQRKDSDWPVRLRAALKKAKLHDFFIGLDIAAAIEIVEAL